MPRFILPIIAATLACSASSFADRQEPHNYDLLDVNWHLSYDADARTIKGDVTNTLAVKEPRSESVWFDCGPLNIEEVTVDGIKALSRLENERLTVTLPRAVAKGKKLKVRIVYNGSPTAGIYFVRAEHSYPAHTGVVYTQGEAEDNRYWLPTYDFPDDKATAEGTIEVPPGQFALSNGKLMSVDKRSSGWTYHWKIAEPISTYLISVVAGDYVEGKEMAGSLPVYWYVPRGTELWGKTSFGGTNKIIDLFGRVTGFKYPFEKFSQSAVADFMFGGMENASCVTQTIRALHKPENEPLANSEGLVAHELAHQWFGDTITCADWSHAWLNEGFASFLPSFWFRATRGQDEFDSERYGTFRGALDSQAGTKRPVVSNRYDVPMDLFDGQIYGGGAARLFTLMGQLGEKVFWKGVKEYLNEYRFKNATTEAFFEVMSRTSKKNLDTFRDQFFYSTDVPTYTVVREGSNVLIRQAAPGYDLDLKLTFVNRDGIAKEVPVHVGGPETIVHAAGMDHDLAVLDYPVTSMVRINYEGAFNSQDLLTIFRLAPNAAGKETAIDRFASVVSDEDLLAVAREERSGPVLRYLVPRLKRNSIPFLVQLSRSFDRFKQSAAVDALGQFADDPMAYDRLQQVWTRESNEMLKNSALQGLLRVAKNDEIARGAWKMDSQDDMFRASALRWWTANQPDVARERCLEILSGEPVEPLRNEAIRQLGSLKDKKDDHVVFDLLMKLAAEQSYGSRMAAVESLVGYGDPRAIEVIEPLTKSSLFFTRRAAQSAVARLQKK